MNSSNEKLLTIPQILNFFQLETKFINQELRYFFGMLSPKDFTRKLASVEVWSSSWVAFFVGLSFSRKDFSFFIENFVVPSDMLSFQRSVSAMPTISQRKSFFGLEIFAIPTLFIKVYFKVRKYSLSALYFYLSQLIYVWISFGMYSVSRISVAFVNIFERIPGFGNVVEHFKLNLGYDVWTPALPGSLEYIKAYRKDLTDLYYNGQDVFAFYEETYAPVWYRLGLSDSDVYEDFWENYDFRNNRANFWFQTLYFQTSPEDIPLYPPRFDLEDYYNDRNYSNVYDMWDTEADAWFIERDKSIIERSPRVWAFYVFEDPNYHSLKGLDERLKRLRFATIMKIFQERFPNKNKWAII